MLSADVLKQIRQIELRAAHLVTSSLTGNYLSAFKGRGMEFDEVREYVPGDDVRAIDWNVTARMHMPFVKVLREERELTIMLMVDVSASQEFGTVGRFKKELAAELAAVLAFLAIRNNDKVGLIVFSDLVEHYIPPKKGRGHVWRIIRTVLTHENRTKRSSGLKPRTQILSQVKAVRPPTTVTATDLSGALDFMTKVTSRRSLCFMISDFWAVDFERSLTLAARRHDLVCVQVRDPRESELPNAGMALFEDAETGELVELDTGDPAVRRAYDEQLRMVDDAFKKSCQRLGIDSFKIRTDAGVTAPLISFLRRRERRRHR